MKLFILFFLILNATLYGYSYNRMLIKAQVSVFPKILLLDKKLDNKLVGDRIVFIIAYEEGDRDTAVHIQELLLQRHKLYLSTHKFETKIVEFSKISQETEATAIYALNSEANIKNISKICASKGIVSFTYDINNLKEGLMFSLVIEKNAALYLNKKNLNSDMTDFIEPLYEIVKFTN